MMKEDLGVSKAQAWGCARNPQEIFKDTQASKLGDAPVHPLLHQQSSVCPSFHYIFITSCVMCCSCSVFALSFMPMCTPNKYSRRLKRLILGMPPCIPFFINNYQFVPRSTIFLSLHALCAMLGASRSLIFYAFFC